MTKSPAETPVQRGGRGLPSALMPAAQGLLALAGAGVSGYLTVVHLQGSEALCGGVGNCELVQNSSYAELGGMPVALLGLLAYLAILSLCLLRLTPYSREWLPLAVFGLSLAAVIYSAYLTYVELFILEAICVWCVASAALVTAIFGLVTVEVVRAQGI